MTFRLISAKMTMLLENATARRSPPGAPRRTSGPRQGPRRSDGPPLLRRSRSLPAKRKLSDARRVTGLEVPRAPVGLDVHRRRRRRWIEAVRKAPPCPAGRDRVPYGFPVSTSPVTGRPPRTGHPVSAQGRPEGVRLRRRGGDDRRATGRRTDERCTGPAPSAVEPVSVDRSISTVVLK